MKTTLLVILGCWLGLNLIGVITGLLDSVDNKCREPAIRWHYIAPAHPLVCWLNETP